MVRNANSSCRELSRRAGGCCRVLLLASSVPTSTKTPSPRTRSSPTRCCSTRPSTISNTAASSSARLTLQTLMNTYDTSEYLAKAKLAMADSWYREGGAHGLAQAEAEYKDFILFYPAMEEAAEAQEKICNIQYQQMDKSDRDPHARPARRGRMPAAAGAVPQQQVRARGATEAARHPGSAGRRANSERGHVLSHARAASRRPPTGCGPDRPVPALQPGRRSACG